MFSWAPLQSSNLSYLEAKAEESQGQRLSGQLGKFGKSLSQNRNLKISKDVVHGRALLVCMKFSDQSPALCTQSNATTSLLCEGRRVGFPREGFSVTLESVLELAL